MTSYNTYPILPSAQSIKAQPPGGALPPQTAEWGLASGAPPRSQAGSAERGPGGTYLLNVVQAKQRGLVAKEKMFKKKYKKYNKILNRCTWLNACSSGIRVAIGISSVATFATFIGLPVSIPLGAASMTGAIASGIISVLTKTYQQKLKKVTKLIDIVTPALVVSEKVVSKSLKDGVIDEEEFNALQTLHLEKLNKLTCVDLRMEAEHRSLVEKSPLEEINELKKKA